MFVPLYVKCSRGPIWMPGLLLITPSLACAAEQGVQRGCVLTFLERQDVLLVAGKVRGYLSFFLLLLRTTLEQKKSGVWHRQRPTQEMHQREIFQAVGEAQSLQGLRGDCRCILLKQSWPGLSSSPPDLKLYTQKIHLVSKAPGLKKAFKLLPQSHWNQWDLNISSTLLMFLSILLNWVFYKHTIPLEPV